MLLRGKRMYLIQKNVNKFVASANGCTSQTTEEVATNLRKHRDVFGKPSLV